MIRVHRYGEPENIIEVDDEGTCPACEIAGVWEVGDVMFAVILDPFTIEEGLVWPAGTIRRVECAGRMGPGRMLLCRTVTKEAADAEIEEYKKEQN